jgi:murein L,D-transpeptidase YafK
MQNPLILSLSLFSLCFFSFTKENYIVSKRSSGIIGTPYIIIDKSDFELSVYDDAGWYATYPAVFGNKNLGDKMMEGDRKTPEGSYRIVSKRPHEKWDKIMLINYPTPADREKFDQRKAKGLIPRNASIGGGIGIHGTWPRDDMAVDYMQQWTNGCISLKREDIDDLYGFIPVGTRVTIRK